MTNQPGEIAHQGRLGPGSPSSRSTLPVDGVLSIPDAEPLEIVGACGHCPETIVNREPVAAQKALTEHLVNVHNLRAHVLRFVDIDVAALVTRAAPPRGRVL